MDQPETCLLSLQRVLQFGCKRKCVTNVRSLERRHSCRRIDGSKAGTSVTVVRCLHSRQHDVLSHAKLFPHSPWVFRADTLRVRQSSDAKWKIIAWNSPLSIDL